MASVKYKDLLPLKHKSISEVSRWSEPWVRVLSLRQSLPHQTGKPCLYGPGCVRDGKIIHKTGRFKILQKHISPNVEGVSPQNMKNKP